MKIFAIYNMKGGVGKTAAAVNLAYEAAETGNRVLVWDLDPQAATTFYFRVKPKVKGGTKRLVKGANGLDPLIKGTDFDRLDLLPADFSYRKLDHVLGKQRKDTRMRRLLSSLNGSYDYICLDCPPSISQLSENVFRAADALVVPLLPTTLSLRTFDQIADFCADKKYRKLKILPFLSMADRRKALHKEIISDFLSAHMEALPTVIPYAAVVERMGLKRAPVGSYARRAPASVAYASLWQDLLDAVA